MPYTQAQIVNFGVTIISNTHNFETTFINWNYFLRVAHTWATFKTHFTTARRYLKKSRGRTMRSATFHQANIMASNLDNVHAEVLSEVQNVQINFIEVMTSVQPPEKVPKI